MQENGDNPVTLPYDSPLAGDAPCGVRPFVAALAARRELHEIAVEVDPELELAAISVALCRQGGPALRFLRPRGYAAPLVTNLFATPGRAALALGGETPQGVAARWEALLAAAGDGPAQERLLRLSAAAQPPLVPDIERRAGDLSEIPALRCWPGDGGRYLTLPLVVTRPPEGGPCNWGLYRVQILDRTRAAIAWRPDSGAARHHAAWQERGRPLPVTIVLGAPPALVWAASAPFPAAVDEGALLARFLGRPLPLAEGAVHGLPFPASAEVVIEGEVGRATVTEGPFGHHSGGYHAAAPAPLFTLTRLGCRPDFMVPAAVAGPPPQEHLPLAQLTARLFVPLLRADVPQLLDLAFPPATIFHGCALARVRDDGTPAAQLCAALRRSELLRRAPLLVLLDEESDPHDFGAAYWRIVNRVRLARDVAGDGERLDIDARRRPAPAVAPDPAILALLRRRWHDYGLSGVALPPADQRRP